MVGTATARCSVPGLAFEGGPRSPAISARLLVVVSTSTIRALAAREIGSASSTVVDSGSVALPRGAERTRGSRSNRHPGGATDDCVSRGLHRHRSIFALAMTPALVRISGWTAGMILSAHASTMDGPRHPEKDDNRKHGENSNDNHGNNSNGNNNSNSNDNSGGGSSPPPPPRQVAPPPSAPCSRRSQTARSTSSRRTTARSPFGSSPTCRSRSASPSTSRSTRPLCQPCPASR